MREKKKVLNQVYLDQDNFEEIVREANKVGEDVRYFINDVVEFYLLAQQQIEKSGETDPKIEVLQISQQMRREERLRKEVYKIAAIYCENPNESNAERLEKACDVANILYEEVVSAAENDPFSSIIAQNASRTALSGAIIWLTSLFEKHDEIPSSEVYTLGDTEGFGPRTIERAKSVINEDADSPSIQSVRRSSNWVWKLVRETDSVEDIHIPKKEKPKPLLYFLSDEVATIQPVDSEDEE